MSFQLLTASITTGLDLATVVLSPNCPLALLPQAYNVPSKRIPNEWVGPITTLLQPMPNVFNCPPICP